MEEDSDVVDQLLFSAIYEAAARKLELAVVPRISSSSLSLSDVKLGFMKSGLLLNVTARDEVIIARFQSEKEMEKAVAFAEENGKDLGFSLQKVAQMDKKDNDKEEPDIIVFETFPIDSIKEFVSSYQDENPSQSLTPIPLIKGGSSGRRVFKMNPKTNLLANNANAIGTKSCIVCNNRTTFQCSKTEASICSKECQQRTTKTTDHEKENPTFLNKKFLLVNYDGPKNLYIRPLDDQERFLQLMNVVATQGKVSQYLDRFSAQTDETVIAFYKDFWYRGTIVEVLPNSMFRVFMPDLHVQEIFPIKRLKLPDDPEKLRIASEVKPPFKVHLEGIESDGISYECEKILTDIINNQTPLLSQSDCPDEMTFQVDHAGGGNLAELLNKTLTLTVSTEGESYFQKDLKPSPVKSEENLPMVLTDFTECEWAIGLANAEYFQKCYRYESHFQEFAEQSEGFYTPRDREVCLVRMKSPGGKSSRWLRATGIWNKGDQHPRFELLDYGIVVKVHIADIRKIPKELLYPAASLTYSPIGDFLKEDPVLLKTLRKREYQVYPVLIERIQASNSPESQDQVMCRDLLQQVEKICFAEMA